MHVTNPDAGRNDDMHTAPVPPPEPNPVPLTVLNINRLPIVLGGLLLAAILGIVVRIGPGSPELIAQAAWFVLSSAFVGVLTGRARVPAYSLIILGQALSTANNGRSPASAADALQIIVGAGFTLVGLWWLSRCRDAVVVDATAHALVVRTSAPGVGVIETERIPGSLVLAVVVDTVIGDKGTQPAYLVRVRLKRDEPLTSGHHHATLHHADQEANALAAALGAPVCPGVPDKHYLQLGDERLVACEDENEWRWFGRTGMWIATLVKWSIPAWLIVVWVVAFIGRALEALGWLVGHRFGL